MQARRTPTRAVRALPGSSRGRSRGWSRGHSLTGLGASLVRAVFPPHCGAQTPKALSCLEITALQWVWKKRRPCRRGAAGAAGGAVSPVRGWRPPLGFQTAQAVRQARSLPPAGIGVLGWGLQQNRPPPGRPPPLDVPTPQPPAGLGCSTARRMSTKPLRHLEPAAAFPGEGGLCSVPHAHCICLGFDRDREEPHRLWV